MRSASAATTTAVTNARGREAPDRYVSRPSFADLSVAVVTHEFFQGSGQELKAFLLRHHTRRLAYIAHKFYYAPQRFSYVEVYEGGRATRRGQSWSFPGREFPTYLKDAVYTLWVFARLPKPVDEYIGVNSFNALLGLLLKALGKVRRVVFFTIDYVMDGRFSWEPLNVLYRAMDRAAFLRSDVTWNVSERMSAERRRVLGERARTRRQLTVPIGIPDEAAPLSSTQQDRPILVYSGSLTHESGVTLLIEAVPALVTRFPSLEVRIVGTGPLADHLRERVAELDVSGHVHVFGHVDTTRERARWLRLLAESTIGIAPYADTATTYKRFSDVTKPKDYMACGLPVVITNVVPLADDVRRYNLGRVVAYTAPDLVRGVSELLSDRGERERIRANVLRYVRAFTWDAIFTRTFATMGIACPVSGRAQGSGQSDRA